MDCQELMVKDVFSVSDTDSVQHAAQVMADGNVGFLPVCSSIREVLGVITDRDIVLRTVAKGLPGETAVGDIMTHGAALCGKRGKVTNAIKQMREDKLSRLICVDENGALAGVLSLDDVMRHEQFRSSAASVEETLAVERS